MFHGRGTGRQHIEFLLGKVANGQATAFRQDAALHGEGLGNRFNQGRFTLTIGAQNADALTG